MDGGAPRGVGNVMMAQQKFHCHRIVSRHTEISQSFRQSEDKPRNPLIGGPASEIDDEFVRSDFFLNPGLTDFLKSTGIPEEERLQLSAIESAIRHIGNSLDKSGWSGVKQKCS